MKKYAKPLALVLALILLLSGCAEGYASHYKALMCVHSNTGTAAELHFSEFTGTMAFKMKLKAAEGAIRYTARLETGEATVYYDYMGEKTVLFTLRGGESVDSAGGYIEKGTVYVIVETNGTCKNGAFDFGI